MKLKPYPEYRDSGAEWLGEIPSHWEMIRTKYIFHEVDERSKLGEETHLSMSQIHGLVESSKIDSWRLHSESYAGGKLCRKNDLVLNRLKAHLGVFAYAPLGGIVSPDYTVFRIKEGNEVRFFETLFKTPVFIGELRCFTKGIVEGFWRLYSDDFYKIRIPIPPEEEQIAILRWIKWFDSKINRFIRNKRSLIKLLNEQKQVIINQAVTRGINRNALLKSSSISYLGDVPSHWKFLPFSRLSRVNRGASPRPSGDPRFFYGNYIPWLTVGEVTKDESIYLDNTDTCLTELGCKLSRVFKKGTLVITNSGATLGVPKILNIDVCANDGIVAFNQLSSSVNSIFAYYFLKSNTQRLREELRQGGTQPNLNTELIKSIVCPIPPVEEQIQIVDFIDAQLSDIEKVISKAEHEIELMREYRTRLISDVVTGKIDVRDIEIPALPDEDIVEELEDEELLEEAEAELEEDGNTDE